MGFFGWVFLGGFFNDNPAQGGDLHGHSTLFQNNLARQKYLPLQLYQ